MNDSIFSLGLNWKEFVVLVLAIIVLYAVSHIQERGTSIRAKILEQPLVIRWAIYICSIVVIMIFGTYGYGANAQDFIYGGF
jgi:alginate O-acetyltransferase complex protein AlgI